MKDRKSILQQETENLKFMWNRYTLKKLQNYLRKTEIDPRVAFTKNVILEYLRKLNPKVNFSKEENITNVLVMIARKLQKIRKVKWIKRATPFSKSLFDNVLKVTGFLRRSRLKNLQIKKPSIVDIGCGSGNYYRVFLRSGINDLINYKGVDIAEKNIKNCSKLFPNGDFSVGNLLDLNLADSSFDIVMVNSVFEHLSPKLLKKAFSEAIRVGKDLIIFNFFNEMDIPKTIVRSKYRYHWNTLGRKDIFKLININPKDINITDYYSGRRVRLINSKGDSLSFSTWVFRKKRS